MEVESELKDAREECQTFKLQLESLKVNHYMYIHTYMIIKFTFAFNVQVCVYVHVY